MESGTWILLAGVVVAALGVMVGGVTGIVVVARFIFRLDAKVDRLVEDMSELKTYVRDIAASLASLIERTAKLEGRVDELSRDKRE